MEIYFMSLPFSFFAGAGGAGQETRAKLARASQNPLSWLNRFMHYARQRRSARQAAAAGGGPGGGRHGGADGPTAKAEATTTEESASWVIG